jgi:hypothetical protein
MYGRKFASELGKLVSGAKNIATDISNDEIKGLIESGNREHVLADLYDHISQHRVEEAVREIIALQQMATTPSQSDDVIIAFISGILNGCFTNNLGKDVREKLKIVGRHSGIPFAHRIEHYDAADKISELLKLASIGLGKKEFSKFTYKSDDQDRLYNPADFK